MATITMSKDACRWQALALDMKRRRQHPNDQRIANLILEHISGRKFNEYITIEFPSRVAANVAACEAMMRVEAR